MIINLKYREFDYIIKIEDKNNNLKEEVEKEIKENLFNFKRIKFIKKNKN